MVKEVSHNTPPRAKRWLFALALVVWAVLSYIAAQSLVLGAMQALQGAGVDFETVNEAMFQTIATAVIWVLVLGLAVGVPYLALRSRTTLEQIGLHRLPTWSEVGLAPLGYVASTIAAVVVTALVAQVFPGFDASQEQEVGFSSLTLQYEYIVAFITLVIIAPVAEEIFFRGYLYGKLKQYIPTWVAIIIVSALFGVAHGQANVAVLTFVMGVFLCLLRDLTGSLWPAIMMHMMRNGIAYYFLFVNPTLINSVGG